MTPTEQKAFDAMREALKLAMDNLRPHGDNCFLHDEGEYNACFCGKDSLVDHLQSVAENAECSKVTSEYSEQPQAQGDELESEMLDAAISWSESNGIDVLEPEQLFSLVKSLYITVRDAGEAAKPVMSIPRSYGHLDANTLEQVAKEYPNEYFLKGSGVLKLITAIRELEQKASEPAWRPIETAPKDGTVVDLWHEEFGRYPDCYWGLPVHTCGEMSSLCDSDVHSMDEGWVDTFNEIQFPANQYTHWMPLPAAPEAKQ